MLLVRPPYYIIAREGVIVFLQAPSDTVCTCARDSYATIIPATRFFFERFFSSVRFDFTHERIFLV